MSQPVPELDWNDLKLFLAVAREGGLSAGARITGRSAATLGRRMLALEAALGGPVFVREPHGYTLTEAGERLLDALTSVERRIESGMSTLGERLPLVTISAGTWTTRYLARHGLSLQGEVSMRVRFIAADRPLSIARRETHIGIRNARPDIDGLVVRRIGVVRFAGYSTTTADPRWIRVLGDTPSARWLAQHEGGAAAFETTSPLTAYDLALAGVGHALLPTFVGDAEPALIRSTDTIDALTHDRWLVMHAEERRRVEVRALVERLVTLLDEPPA